MAKLHFYYSAMNAGKTTTLLQSSYNYCERGMNTLIFKPSIDSRFSKNEISSRIGISQPAISFSQTFNFFNFIQEQLQKKKIHCVLVDEAQFLRKEQILQLIKIMSMYSLPVLTYGLRTDFQGEPFEGSLYLLSWAEHIIEIKTICYCGKKATMNLRINANGEAITTGEQIEIGGNDRYIALCQKHFREKTDVKHQEKTSITQR